MRAHSSAFQPALVTTVGAAIVEVVGVGIGLGAVRVGDAEGLGEVVAQVGYAWAKVGSCPGHGLADAVGDTDVDGEAEALVVVDGEAEAEAVVVVDGVAEAVAVVDGEAVVAGGLVLSDGVGVTVVFVAYAARPTAGAAALVLVVRALPGSMRSTVRPAGSVATPCAATTRTCTPLEAPDHMGDMPPRTPGRSSSAGSGMSSGWAMASHRVQVPLVADRVRTSTVPRSRACAPDQVRPTMLNGAVDWAASDFIDAVAPVRARECTAVLIGPVPAGAPAALPFDALTVKAATPAPPSTTAPNATQVRALSPARRTVPPVSSGPTISPSELWQLAPYAWKVDHRAFGASPHRAAPAAGGLEPG